MLRHSIFYSRPNYPEGIFLNRDLTKEDRTIEKNMYMQRKQQRIAARGNNNRNDTNNHRGPTTDAQQQNRMAAEHRPAAERGDQAHPRPAVGHMDPLHPQVAGEAQQP